MGLMVDRYIAPASIPVLVDLGSVNEKSSRDRADALMAGGLSRRNFSIEGHGRLLVKFPKKLSESLLGQFPIIPGSTYWQTTHHWRGLKKGETVAEIPRKGPKP